MKEDTDVLCISPFAHQIVRLSGDLDFASRAATERSLRDADADVVVLDLTDVRYLDAGALGCFVGLKKRLRERGRLGIVRVVAPDLKLRRLFAITGLARVFDVCESLDKLSSAAS